MRSRSVTPGLGACKIDVASSNSQKALGGHPAGSGWVSGGRDSTANVSARIALGRDRESRRNRPIDMTVRVYSPACEPRVARLSANAYSMRLRLPNDALGRITLVGAVHPARRARLRAWPGGVGVGGRRAPVVRARLGRLPPASTSGRNSPASAVASMVRACRQRRPQEPGAIGIGIRGRGAAPVDKQASSAARTAGLPSAARAGLLRRAASHEWTMPARPRRASRSARRDRRSAATAPRTRRPRETHPPSRLALANWTRSGVPASSPWNSLNCHCRESSHSGSASGAESPARMLIAVGASRAA